MVGVTDSDLGEDHMDDMTMHDPYEDQLSAARYKAERDMARQELGEHSDAIAWVRDHGGIAYVKDAWKVRSNLKRQLDTAQAKVERQQRHIMFVQDKCRERQNHIVELNKMVADMRPRLMPEGMEWLVEAWPRFEDGEPVKFGEEAIGFACKPPFVVDHITIFAGGEATVCAEADDDSGKVENFVLVFPGECVKRPSKVLDADGAEIELGDDLYSVEGSLKFHVSHIDRINGKIATDAMFSLDKWADPAMYTHRAPVIAADGKPLREGETVWSKGGCQYVVEDAIDPNAVKCRSASVPTSGMTAPASCFTHERPVVDTWERLEEDAKKGSCDYFGCDANGCHGCPAYDWNTARGGNGCGNAKTLDLVRRAKALAGDA